MSGVLLMLTTLAGFLGYTYYRSRKEFGPGGSIDETAHILVYDFKFGHRAKQKAIKHGDAILPIIQQKTNNFAHLDHSNVFRFADVLGAIQTERSRAILTELYDRTDPISRLLGAVGLAQHDAFPDAIEEKSFLVTIVRMNPGQTEMFLAIKALGLTRKQAAIPCLLELLTKHEIGYASFHSYACEAIARIRSLDAIPILRDCLKSAEFYALPQAFRALITLGDREAVPLAIARLTPELSKHRRRSLVKELHRVTGQFWRHHQTGWNRWWRSVADDWRIPKAYRKPWDEQNFPSAPNTMNPCVTFLLTGYGIICGPLSWLRSRMNEFKINRGDF